MVILWAEKVVLHNELILKEPILLLGTEFQDPVDYQSWRRSSVDDHLGRRALVIFAPKCPFAMVEKVQITDIFLKSVTAEKLAVDDVSHTDSRSY